MRHASLRGHHRGTYQSKLLTQVGSRLLFPNRGLRTNVGTQLRRACVRAYCIAAAPSRACANDGVQQFRTQHEFHRQSIRWFPNTKLCPAQRDRSSPTRFLQVAYSDRRGDRTTSRRNQLVNDRGNLQWSGAGTCGSRCCPCWELRLQCPKTLWSTTHNLGGANRVA